jgi:hypothetical protein
LAGAKSHDRDGPLTETYARIGSLADATITQIISGIEARESAQ